VSLVALHALPNDEIAVAFLKARQHAVASISDLNCVPQVLQLQSDLLETDKIGGR